MNVTQDVTRMGDSCGTITISVYRNNVSHYPFFLIQSDNEQELSSIMDVLEDTLKCY